MTFWWIVRSLTWSCDNQRRRRDHAPIIAARTPLLQQLLDFLVEQMLLQTVAHQVQLLDFESRHNGL